MRLAASVLVLVGWGFSTIAPQASASAPAAATPAPAAVAAVQAVGAPDPAIVAAADAFTKAVAAKDVKALAALYAEDAIEMPPNEPAIKGRAAIEAHYAKLFHGPGPILEESGLTHIEATVSGPMAIDVGTWRDRIKLPDGGTVTAVGKYVVVLKRVGDDWKMAYVIYNEDTPAPPPPPSGMSAVSPKPPRAPKPPVPPPAPPPPPRRD